MSTFCIQTVFLIPYMTFTTGYGSLFCFFMTYFTPIVIRAKPVHGSVRRIQRMALAARNAVRGLPFHEIAVLVNVVADIAVLDRVEDHVLLVVEAGDRALRIREKILWKNRVVLLRNSPGNTGQQHQECGDRDDGA